MNTITSEGRFHILNEAKHNGILVSVSFEILPIVWNRNGEYCIIPREAVANAVDIMAMHKDYSRKRTIPAAMIIWSQGIPISNQAGRAMVGE